MNSHRRIGAGLNALPADGLLAGCIGLTLALGWIHYSTGRAYEFHVFFAVPILVVAWFLGFRRALAVVVLATGVWFTADRALEGDQADVFPLIFNSAVRLAIFVMGAWMLARLHQVLDREAGMAREDTLTRLANRRAFLELGRAAVALTRRQEGAMTAVFIDLDKFKQVNDEHGHDTGDAVLRRVAEVFRGHVRTSDIAGRLGGDEFALLLPGMDGRAALAYVEDLRQRLLAAMRASGWPVTFSIGIVSYRQAPEDLESLLVEADRLMYAAKQAGRDRITQCLPDAMDDEQANLRR
jgi:diguanylate cyclase (GGDEF)-like protein